jgi:hypothetical protein
MTSSNAAALQEAANAGGSRWILYPDAPGGGFEPRAELLQQAREVQRTWMIRGAVGFGVFIVVLASLGSSHPGATMLLFCGAIAWTVAWHVRNSGRVQRGFEQWCAERGLVHVAGNISPGYRRPVHAQSELTGVHALVAALDRRPTSTSCEVAGRLWEASPPGRISTITTRRRGERASPQLTVVEAPLDPALAARLRGVLVVDRSTNALFAPMMRITHGDGWRELGGMANAGPDMAVFVRGDQDEADVRELLDGTALGAIARASDVAGAGLAGIALLDGRFLAFSPSTFAFYGAGVDVGARMGVIRRPGGYAGADALLDERIAAARDACRALLER